MANYEKNQTENLLNISLNDTKILRSITDNINVISINLKGEVNFE